MIKIDRKFLVIFAVVLVVFSALSLYYYHKSVQPDGSISWVDFRVYYYAGLKMEMNTDIYDLSGEYFVYKYSPIFALIMSVIKFSTVTLAGALRAWYVVLFIFFLTSLYLVKEILYGRGEYTRFRFFDIVPLLFAFRYLVLINFTRAYIPAQWPLWVTIYDKILLCVLVPLWILSLFFGEKKDYGKRFLFVMALSFLFVLRFLALNIDRAQVNIVLLGLLLFFAYYLVNKKDVTAGVYLGIASAFKLTPAIFLIYLVVKRRFKAFFASAATFIALLFMPSFKLGFRRNIELVRDWIGALRMTLPSEYIQHKNQSLFAMVSRFFSENSGISVIKLDSMQLTLLIGAVYALFMALLIYLIMRKGGKSGRDETIFDFSLFFIAMTILSPIGTKTTFIYTLLPITLLLKEAFDRHLKCKILNAGLAIYLLFIYLNSPDIVGDFCVVLHKYSLMTGCLLLIFALTAYAKFSRLQTP